MCGKLHTAVPVMTRWRQICTFYLKDQLSQITGKLLNLRQVLLDLAEPCGDYHARLPAHLRHAQPVLCPSSVGLLSDVRFPG